jgi:hypothetical protein
MTGRTTIKRNASKQTEQTAKEYQSSGGRH